MSCELDQNCPYEKPGLGSQAAVINDVGSTITEIVGVSVTVGSLIVSVVSDPATFLIISRLVGELGLGLVVAVVAWVMWAVKCESNTEGTNPCLAGIIDSLIPPATTSVTSAVPVDFLAEAADELESFTEKNTDLFPFMKELPSFNLVVRCQDWERISENSEYVWFNNREEPYIVCYQRDHTLCAALLGTAVGATVGGIGGFAAGWWADAAFLAICGLSIFCAILAIIVGAFVALAGGTLGAVIGNEIDQAFASEEEGEDARVIRVGDYVAVKGNMVNITWANNASGLYFVEEWCWYGQEDSTLPPFDHMMARDYFLTEEGEDKAYWFCKLGIKDG